MDKVVQLWAFVAMPEDRDHGIPAFKRNGALIPLVCSEERILDIFRPLAQEVAEKEGIKVELRKFNLEGVVETFEPT